MRLDPAKWDALLGAHNQWECVDMDSSRVLPWVIEVDTLARTLTRYILNDRKQLVLRENRNALATERVALDAILVNVPTKRVFVRIAP